jgi:hypothetical protein
MKHLQNLLLISIATFLLSCKDDSKDDRCHQYFLVKEKNVNRAGSQFFYNSDGLLSAMYFAPYNQLRIEFVYDENKNLTRANYGDAYTTFNFMDANSLSIVEYDGTREKLDSVVVVYDNSGRVAKRTEYIGNPWHLYEYDTAVYIDNGTAKISKYDANMELSFTGTFMLDNHLTPYPKEYSYYLLSTGYAVVPGNILSYTYEDELIDSYNYDYNADGYPTRYSTNGVYLSSYVYSCEPVHE